MILLIVWIIIYRYSRNKVLLIWLVSESVILVVMTISSFGVIFPFHGRITAIYIVREMFIILFLLNEIQRYYKNTKYYKSNILDI